MINKRLMARFTPEIIVRIKTLTSSYKVCTNELISLALDALERERKLGHSLPERVAFLEKNLATFHDLVMTFGEKIEEKFSEASANEIERIRSLFTLLDNKISEHDDAEALRFHQFVTSLHRVKEP
jgi:hypothetical protein